MPAGDPNMNQDTVSRRRLLLTMISLAVLSSLGLAVVATPTNEETRTIHAATTR
jgi:hypothetical protein